MFDSLYLILSAVQYTEILSNRFSTVETVVTIQLLRDYMKQKYCIILYSVWTEKWLKRKWTALIAQALLSSAGTSAHIKELVYSVCLKSTRLTVLDFTSCCCDCSGAAWDQSLCAHH